jgi:hypothetical protein
MIKSVDCASSQIFASLADPSHPVSAYVKKRLKSQAKRPF